MSERPDVDAGMLAHELRNTLSAIDMLLEHAEARAAAGENPGELLGKARAGIAETLEVVQRYLEEPDARP